MNPIGMQTTDAAGLVAQTVEYFQVQRLVFAVLGSTWCDLPDGARADEIEAFDLVDELSREWPATRYRVVRRFKGRE